MWPTPHAALRHVMCCAPSPAVSRSLIDIKWSRGVTVSTLDSESNDRGSNPRETFDCICSFDPMYSHDTCDRSNIIIVNSFATHCGTCARSVHVFIVSVRVLSCVWCFFFLCCGRRPTFVQYHDDNVFVFKFVARRPHGHAQPFFFIGGEFENGTHDKTGPRGHERPVFFSGKRSRVAPKTRRAPAAMSGRFFFW